MKTKYNWHMRDPTPHDNSYFVLMILTGISAILTVPLLVAYGVGIYNSYKGRTKR